MATSQLAAIWYPNSKLEEKHFPLTLFCLLKNVDDFNVQNSLRLFLIVMKLFSIQKIISKSILKQVLFHLFDFS